MGLIDYLEIRENGINNPYCRQNLRNFGLMEEIATQSRPYFFGGAISLVFSSGILYRCHQDFDLFALPEDFGYWLDFFQSRGITMKEDVSRDGRPIFRGMSGGEWIFDAKFVPFDSLADDNRPYEIMTAQVGPYNVNIISPEYNRWQKVWMLFKGEGRTKDFRDLQVYE